MKTRRIALVTGASSGLGSVFARRFAQYGCDLIITGRQQDKLTQLSGELQAQYGISVECIIAELSDDNDVRKILKSIEMHDNLEILVNNAGYGSGTDFCNGNLDTHLEMLQVHVVATLRLIHAVLPQMKRRGEGTIINVSSLGAFMPAPGSSMYAATKLFLKSFTESLHMEVSGYGIRLHCLCPGFTRTDFHKRRASGKAPKSSRLIQWMDAETVVDQCLRSLEKGKIVYVPGFINRMLIIITSVIPRFFYYQLIMKLMQPAGSEATGRSAGSSDVQPVFSLLNRREHLIDKPVSLL
jgi:short-subunit dehydrogenase